MNAQEDLEIEFNSQWGDPRRCPKHGCATSSVDGLFDAPCLACEYESDMAYQAEMNEELGRELGLPLAATLPALPASPPPAGWDMDDDIPF